jgi:DNA-directed RNA polymerase specialized sigma24 family protein
MKQNTTCHVTSESLLHNECFWKDLYDKLHKPVTTFVRRYKVPSWIGQEDDIINEIVQETVVRLYKKFLTSPDEAFSIQNMEAFSYTVAQRYCLDMRRKEKRLTRLPLEGNEMKMNAFNIDDELTKALEAISIQSILIDAARIITKIPNKQRRALLTDLARYNDFTDTPTGIEQALAKAGIQLEEYRHLLPRSQLERSRYNALVSLGYRRMRTDFYAAYQQTSIPTKKQQPSSYLH